MPNLASILFIAAMPFLLGFVGGRNVDFRRDRSLAGFAVLGIVPAVYLLFKSEVDGSHCAGGECIADGFALMAALAGAVVALGFLVGGGLNTWSESDGVSAALVKKISTEKRLLLVILLGVLAIELMPVILWNIYLALHH